MRADFQNPQDPILFASLLLKFSESGYTEPLKMEIVVFQLEKASEMVQCLEQH